MYPGIKIGFVSPNYHMKPLATILDHFGTTGNFLFFKFNFAEIIILSFKNNKAFCDKRVQLVVNPFAGLDA